MVMFCFLSARRRRLLAAAFGSALIFCGCGSQTPAEKVVGHWRGTQTTDNVTVQSDWQFQADGTETVSLRLPQGTMIAGGVWSLQQETLTQRTTSRAIILSGQQKKMPLAHPLERAWHYAFAGDALVLTGANPPEVVTLSRSTEDKP